MKLSARASILCGAHHPPVDAVGLGGEPEQLELDERPGDHRRVEPRATDELVECDGGVGDDARTASVLADSAAGGLAEEGGGGTTPNASRTSAAAVTASPRRSSPFVPAAS